MAAISPKRRQEILDALRRGTVPARGLDVLAVGLDRFEATLDEELKRVAAGGAGFKAVRGEYGSGKTFFSRWLEERARKLGFAISEVQISETETPLHRLETVYRRLVERLATDELPSGAFRSLIDGWFFALEQDVLADGSIGEAQSEQLMAKTQELLEKRLGSVARTAPSFATALRAYREASTQGNRSIADGVLAWLAADPNVGAEVKRFAKLKGDVDHFGALCFLEGLLVILRDSGRAGLVLVLDEVETLQRVRSDARDKALNALRQLLDEIDAGRFPGLYLVLTGTGAFYDGPQGAQRLAPLAQRLHVDFSTEARFDNPRAVQIRLPGFDAPRLEMVGRRVRDLFADHSADGGRIRERADDAYIATLAASVTGELGGKIGVVPRVFLKKLVGDVLDRIDQFADFDPRKHYSLTVTEQELTDQERRARSAQSPDDIELPP